MAGRQPPNDTLVAHVKYDGAARPKFGASSPPDADSNDRRAGHERQRSRLGQGAIADGGAVGRPATASDDGTTRAGRNDEGLPTVKLAPSAIAVLLFRIKVPSVTVVIPS